MNVALESFPAAGEDNIPLSRYISRTLLVVPRVYVGLILFISDLGKLTRDNPFADEMLRFLRGVTTRRAAAPYLHFVQQIVIPHATLFSYLIMTGEAFAAISLLTGTLTRVGAMVAGFLFLNYMLAEGRMFWSPDSEDAALIFICLMLFLGRAGRAFGIDSYLAKRWPKCPLW
jgi:uncharacterized membrane protein YphA (DoxX/SURF4 family)